MVSYSAENMSQAVFTNFAVQFNKNSFGLAPAGNLELGEFIQPGQSVNGPALRVGTGSPNHINIDPIAAANMVVQVAVRTQVGVLFFQDQVPLWVMFIEDGVIEKGEFLKNWKGMDVGADRFKDLARLTCGPSPEAVKELLAKYNVFFVGQTQANGNVSPPPP